SNVKENQSPAGVLESGDSLPQGRGSSAQEVEQTQIAGLDEALLGRLKHYALHAQSTQGLGIIQILQSRLHLGVDQCGLVVLQLGRLDHVETGTEAGAHAIDLPYGVVDVLQAERQCNGQPLPVDVGLPRVLQHLA